MTRLGDMDGPRYKIDRPGSCASCDAVWPVVQIEDAIEHEKTCPGPVLGGPLSVKGFHMPPQPVLSSRHDRWFDDRFAAGRRVDADTSNPPTV